MKIEIETGLIETVMVCESKKCGWRQSRGTVGGHLLVWIGEIPKSKAYIC